MVAGLESAGRDAWRQVEIGKVRVLPALPGEDPELGEIRWDRWERALRLTHFDPSCETCGYEGPLAVNKGMTLHDRAPYRKLLRPSKIAQGQRPQWGPVIRPEPGWVYSHWANRCQACDEMTVWVMLGVLPRCERCGAVTAADREGRREQCGACLREARFVVPGGTGKPGTWVEIHYHPPVTAQIVPEVDGDVLF